MEEPNSATSCRLLSYTSQITDDVRTLCRKEKSKKNSSFIEAVIFLLHRVKHTRQFLAPLQQKKSLLKRKYRRHINNWTERDLRDLVAAKSD
jgi:gamma-glutamyl:cysteine ligase YbdK (ATP-grasp superfamily)